MSVTVCRIAGISVPWKRGNAHSWSMTFGFGAPLQTWEIPKQIAKKLERESLGQEIELQIGPQVFQRIFLIGVLASGDPTTRLVLLTDVRWLLSFGWFVRMVNVRRPTGEVVIVNQADGPEEVALTTAPDVKYAPWSLFTNPAVPLTGAAWTWRLLGTDAVSSATRAVEGRKSIEWMFDGIDGLPVADSITQETWIDDPMPLGLSKVIATLPGFAPYVDPKGILHVAPHLQGTERAIVSSLPGDPFPPGSGIIQSLGSLVDRDRSAERPALYHVKFDKAFEMRMDNRVIGATVDPDDFWLENVLVCQRQTLVVDKGLPTERTVAQGTILTHQQYYDALGTIMTKWGPKKLSDDAVRELFNEGDYLEKMFAYDKDGILDTVMAADIAEIKATYRQLWRINPNAWARTIWADPHLTTIWDSATSTRAKSPVYVNYARRSTHRGYVKHYEISANYTSWDTLRSKCIRAPFEIEWFSREEGIFWIVPKRDPRGESDTVVPSQMNETANVDPTNPDHSSDGPRADGALISALWTGCNWEPASTFRLSVIMTLRPGAPGGTGNLWNVDVPVEDAATLLGDSATAESTSTKSLAPDKSLRNEWIDARFAWDDEASHQMATKLHFGIGLPEGTNRDDPITTGEIVPVNQELELKPAGQAVAAAHLASKLRHFQGTASFPLTKKTLALRPLGAMSRITIKAWEDRAVVTIECGDDTASINPKLLLPGSARKIINQEARV